MTEKLTNLQITVLAKVKVKVIHPTMLFSTQKKFCFQNFSYNKTGIFGRGSDKFNSSKCNNILGQIRCKPFKNSGKNAITYIYAIFLHLTYSFFPNQRNIFFTYMSQNFYIFLFYLYCWENALFGTKTFTFILK